MPVNRRRDRRAAADRVPGASVGRPELDGEDALLGAGDAAGSRLSFPLGAGNENSFRSSVRPLMGVVTMTAMSCPFSERVGLREQA